MEEPPAHALDFLKRAIQALGFTQREVERQLGLSRGYLSRLFRGRIELKTDHVVQIARALQVDPNEFYRLAFRKSIGEPYRETQRLQQTTGLLAPEPSPEELAEIQKDIERIVKRALDRKQGS
ncbi:MAG TPA: helix-turn-helix transcriptional regulator [Thermoanaerobaculia bacterium]|nr:helix-turn-helix transcriptional regulator [Thermoanaerobaculia bacterium]